MVDLSAPAMAGFLTENFNSQNMLARTHTKLICVPCLIFVSLLTAHPQLVYCCPIKDALSLN